MKKFLFIFGLVITFQSHSQQQKNDSCYIRKKTYDCCNSVDREYIKIREKADSCFYAGNYKKALDYYERALSFRSKDEYVLRQIQRMKVYIERGF